MALILQKDLEAQPRAGSQAVQASWDRSLEGSLSFTEKGDRARGSHPQVGRVAHWTDDRLIQRQLSPRGRPALVQARAHPCGQAPGGEAAHRRVRPAMKSRMAAMSSLFQKSLKYRSAIFTSPHSSGS